MKLYSALVKKNSKGKIGDLVIVKEGFSLNAFLFSGFWFLYHRMWREAFFFILLNVIFFQIFSAASDQKFFEVIAIFMVALNANYWLFEHLKKNGYEFVGQVFGSSNSEAKLRFVTHFKSNSKEDAESIFDLL